MDGDNSRPSAGQQTNNPQKQPQFSPLSLVVVVVVVSFSGLIRKV
jgi:hypothetical protein